MFNRPLDERLTLWRTFRENLKLVDNPTALKLTAELWSRTPFVNHYLTPDQPEKWPGPWDLITEDIYCDLAVALGIYYTLSLTGLNKDSLLLKINSQDSLNLVFCNDTVLNYEPCTLINTSQLTDVKFQYVYNFIDLRIENYV